jgi:polar amino acid transport system permease protein
LPVLLRGIAVNLELLVGLIALGLVAGILVALMEVYAPRPLAAIAVGYEWFFRGVPELVLLFLFYFGLSQFGIKISAFFAAVLALGFRSSAYQSQIFRGAIQSVSAGQWLAARSLGMGKLRSVIHIILPQALRLSIPPWSNEFSSVLKDTTLAYGIGVVEVLRQARYLNARNFRLAMPAYITVALLFLLLTYLGNWSLGRLERRLRIPGMEKREGGERAMGP